MNENVVSVTETEKTFPDSSLYLAPRDELMVSILGPL